MIDIDARSLLLIIGLCHLAQACVLLYVWYIHNNYRPARAWGIGSLLGAVGTLMVSLRERIPDLLSIFLGNTLIIFGLMVYCFGIARAAGRQPPWTLGTVIGAAVAGILFWYGLIAPALVPRLLAITLANTFFTGYATLACLLHRGSALTVSFRFLALIHALVTAGTLLRFFITPVAASPSAYPSGPGEVVFLILGLMFYIVIAPTLVLLTSQVLQEKLKDIARHDPLTQALNRRALEEISQREWPLAMRRGQPLSCLLLDIDHFKNFNDRHGHRTGDLVLETVSAVAKAVLRNEDVWCRYGGEEFVALLPQTSLEQARLIGERLRKDVAAIRVAGSDGAQLGITVSIGAASNSSASSWPELLQQADQALYQAKQTGRDRVDVFAAA